MTGIADFYLYLKRPYSIDRRKRLLAHFNFLETEKHQRFVVLSWKRTGSNLLCGILHHHPEILMHNELFNPIDIFTYHPAAFTFGGSPFWTVLTRDLFPLEFLDYIWKGRLPDGREINPYFKAVGFKSFPVHWLDVRNEHVWQEAIMYDIRVKKIILHREDELAVYVSMLRAEQTGNYMTHAYPPDLKLQIDVASFQLFLDNYRDTVRRKYKSPTVGRDTFNVTYEELLDEERFTTVILTKLWEFLGIDPTVPLMKLQETTRQADPDEDLSAVIENYEELEFCFRHSDLLHFVRKRKEGKPVRLPALSTTESVVEENSSCVGTWSILLPICSRNQTNQPKSRHDTLTNGVNNTEKHFNTNRLLDLTKSSQYIPDDDADEKSSWAMFEGFCQSLRATTSLEQLACTECIVGIDVDDPIYQTGKDRIIAMLHPCEDITFVPIKPEMYGKVCRIWNHLARKTKNEYVVLLGDDVRLLDLVGKSALFEDFTKLLTKRGCR